MISNHARFVEAIHEKTKVCVRYYSKSDIGVLIKVCAPMDYGPGGDVQDGLSRYWLWDFSSTTGSHALGLLAGQIQDLQVLGDGFDPASLVPWPMQWTIQRNWASLPQSVGKPAATAAPASVVLT